MASLDLGSPVTEATSSEALTPTEPPTTDGSSGADPVETISAAETSNTSDVSVIPSETIPAQA